MSNESRRLGGIRGQNVKNVRSNEDFEWITVDGMPLKRRRPHRKPAQAGPGHRDAVGSRAQPLSTIEPP